MEKKRRWVGIALTIVLALCTGIVGSGAGYVVGSQRAAATATDAAQRSVTPTVAVTPTPTLTRTFSDLLTEGDTTGWLQGTPGTNGTCWFASDGYHSIGETCFDPLGEVGDESVSVAVSQVSGPAQDYYGLAIHRVSVGNEYYFLVNSSGVWEFIRSVSSQDVIILSPTPSAALHTGLHATNTLTLTDVGGHFDLALNGVHVGETADATYPAGKSGVTSTVGVEAVFTNYSVQF